MYDITGIISILIRIAILEIPVFCAIRFIWKNFLGTLKFILIFVLFLLAYGLYFCLGKLLPSADKFYLSTTLDSVSLLALSMLAVSAVCLVLVIIFCIYLRVSGKWYEEYDKQKLYEQTTKKRLSPLGDTTLFVVLFSSYFKLFYLILPSIIFCLNKFPIIKRSNFSNMIQSPILNLLRILTPMRKNIITSKS